MSSTLTFGEMRTTLEREIDAEILERVQKGLDLLREKYGEDFADHIDPAKLDMQSVSSCVLGQLYRGSDGYAKGLEILSIVGEDYGFDVPDDYPRIHCGGYRELTEVWRSVIKQLQKNRVKA